MVTTIAGLLSALWGVRCFIAKDGDRCSPEAERAALIFLLAGAALETVSIVLAGLS